MKAVILAGGFGTRLMEETHLTPKPMVAIGGYPILYHIMNYIAKYDIDEFIICCGYKSEVIKDYFINFYARNSNLQVNLASGEVKYLNSNAKSWTVTLVDTGLSAMTGGRLLSVKNYLDDEPFLFTYGDGLADVDIGCLIKSHRSANKLATVTAVSPPGRFGALSLNNENSVTEFVEKPRGDGSKINGGYFILEPKVLEYIEDEQTSWEEAPLKRLASEGQLNAYLHNGNWKAMDTLRDKQNLEALWTEGKQFW